MVSIEVNKTILGGRWESNFKQNSLHTKFDQKSFENSRAPYFTGNKSKRSESKGFHIVKTELTLMLLPFTSNKKLAFSRSCILNFLGEVLLANLQPSKKILHEHPNVNDAPSVSSSSPWHIHVLLKQIESRDDFIITTLSSWHLAVSQL